MSRAQRVCDRDLEELERYWLGELETPKAESLEEHLFGCAGCTRRLEELATLQSGLVGLVEDGRVLAATTATTLERAAARGVRFRSYRIPPGGTVNCTIAPDDDASAVRLAGPFAGAGTVDVHTEQLRGGAVVESGWARDVPVDRAAGEIILLNPGEAIRALPASTFRLEVVERAADGASRSLGRYTLEHSPWNG